MFNTNHNTLIWVGWFNAVIGTLLTTLEPVLSSVAYIASIAGSTVYIYVTLKNKNKK